MTETNANQDYAPGIVRMISIWKEESADFPPVSAVEANIALTNAGLIYKNDEGWHATEAGLAMGIVCTLREFQNGPAYQCTYPKECQARVREALLANLPNGNEPRTQAPCAQAPSTQTAQEPDTDHRMYDRSIKEDGLRFGVALDRYTVKSVHIDNPAPGQREFENTYSPLGKLIHNLKYEKENPEACVAIVSDILATAKPALEKHVLFKKRGLIATPMPPTIKREFDPVSHLTEQMAKQQGIGYNPNILTKLSETRAKTLEEGMEFEEDAFTCDLSQVGADAPLLIVDDIYGKGRSLRGCLRALKRAGHTGPVYFISIVYTRKNGLIDSGYDHAQNSGAVSAPAPAREPSPAHNDYLVVDIPF